MASQDRSYYRDSQDGRPSPLLWLLGGSFQVLAAGGLRVRMHTTALLAAIIYLAAGVASADFPQRMLVIGILLALALLHEVGHCVAARMLGGYADDVLLWPLGGLVDQQPPHRPLPVLITTLAGPLANVAICASCWMGLHLMGQPGPSTLNPFALSFPQPSWQEPSFYLHVTFVLSYFVLLLNLPPIIPLDGGRILQCVLWPLMGYGRAVLAACNIGIVLAAIFSILALAVAHWMLFWLMLACVMIGIQRRSVVRAAGVVNYGDLDVDVRRPRHHHLGRFTKWRARRQIRREEAEQARVDQILIKVYHSGLQSLSWREKRLLHRATQRQRAMEETSNRP